MTMHTRFDQELHDWDLVLWTLCQRFASEEPRIAAKTFGLDEEAVSCIAAMPRSTVERLASGTISSFRPLINESRAIEIMSAPHSALAMLDLLEDAGQFDVRYWQLLAKSAQHNPANAAMRYGVSVRIAEMASHCTSTQLSSVASELQAPFRLRFPASLLPSLLRDTSAALPQKIAFCLQN